MPTYTGNTTLENVDANQSITVTDGSLTIRGDVGSGARITLENSQSSGSNQMIFGNSVVVAGNSLTIGNTGHKLTVQGNVHTRANIAGSSDMEFRGYLFDAVTVKTHNGNIITKDLGENVTLTTHNGEITAGNIGCNSSVKSHNGKISVGNVSANVIIKSHNGNVSAISYDPSATIKTHNGKRYINGIRSGTRRENRNNITINGIHIDSSYDGSSFNISNLGNFFSSGTTTIINGRVFINGIEQAVPTTSQVRTTNRNAIHSSNEDDMPAVLQSYLNGFKGESFQDAFKRLAVDVSDKYPYFICIISQDIPNIPVSLDGRLYDWDSLKSQIETNGYKDPMTRETFTLKQVIPDRTTRDSLERILKKEEEIHKSDIATCSSPAFKR
jgi:U-box domain